MKLLIMRHGIAAEREEWKAADELRPLTSEGIEKTRRAVMGLCAIWNEEQIALIASSPLLRATQTAEIAHEALKVKSEIAIWPELEHASFAPLTARLKTHHQSTLMVGHEPGLSQFVSQLLTGSAHGLSIAWKKAAVCALDVEFSEDELKARLLWFATPKQLRVMNRS